MFFYLKYVWVIFLLIVSFDLQLCHAGEIEQKLQVAMLEDLQIVKTFVANKYAPVEWKNIHLQWNLECEYEKACQKIFSGDLKTVKDYHQVLKDFLFSTKDYHVNNLFYSTEVSFLPLNVAGVDNHYFITKVSDGKNINLDSDFEIDEFNVSQLRKSLKSIQVGDELLEINGIPVQTLMEQTIEKDFGGYWTATNCNLAAHTLFFKRARFGIATPSGTVELTFKSQSTKKNRKILLPWLHVSEYIMNQGLKDTIEAHINSNSIDKQSLSSNLEKLVSKDFSVAFARDLIQSTSQFEFDHFSSDLDLDKKRDRKNSENNFDRRQKGFLPNLGRVIWETPKKNTIYAYLYENSSKQKIGYIYLASFSYSDYDAIMDELTTILKKFNNHSAALVFDTTNNTGGNLLFMYAVLSLLTDEPLEVPYHREMIVQEDVFDSISTYKELSNPNAEFPSTLYGYPFNASLQESIKNYSLTIIKNWENGKRFTDPLYLVGIERVQPHFTVRYKKPIIVLVNELNFSCGDFFPAILQDNARATIFGLKTAGAGGHVRPFSYPSRFGLAKLTLTVSIAYRPNGNPVENLGVDPNEVYKMTKNDLLNNYASYRKAVNEAVRKQIRSLI